MFSSVHIFLSEYKGQTCFRLSISFCHCTRDRCVFFCPYLSVSVQETRVLFCPCLSVSVQGLGIFPSVHEKGHVLPSKMTLLHWCAVSFY